MSVCDCILCQAYCNYRIWKNEQATAKTIWKWHHDDIHYCADDNMNEIHWVKPKTIYFDRLETVCFSVFSLVRETWSTRAVVI